MVLLLKGIDHWFGSFPDSDEILLQKSTVTNAKTGLLCTERSQQEIVDRTTLVSELLIPQRIITTKVWEGVRVWGP